jgi:hypothetical protein
LCIEFERNLVVVKENFLAQKNLIKLIVGFNYIEYVKNRRQVAIIGSKKKISIFHKDVIDVTSNAGMIQEAFGLDAIF